MAGKIFVSYRREDSADVCARIYDWLTYRLPPENVYKDVDSIPYGADFMEHVGAYIKQSSVLLLVIGQQWLTPDQGVSHYVRMEIELALQHHIKIIPVLVHEATMPRRRRCRPVSNPSSGSMRPSCMPWIPTFGPIWSGWHPIWASARQHRRVEGATGGSLIRATSC
jgi:hypothetical protein